MRSRCSLLLVTLLAGGCGGRADPSPLTQEQAEKAVWAVPYVADAAERIGREPSGDVHLVLVPQGQRDEDGVPGWSFQVAESHPTHLATVAWVWVNGRTGEVRFEDTTGDGTLLTPEQWCERFNAMNTP